MTHSVILVSGGPVILSLYWGFCKIIEEPGLDRGVITIDNSVGP